MGQGELLAESARNLDRGVVSAKVAAILQRTSGGPILDNDRAQIESAKLLLGDILNGAESVNRRHHVAGATANSIRSLGFALSPLEKLHRLSEAKDATGETLVKMLSEMQTALEQLTAARAIPPSTPALNMTRAFFEYLAESALSSLSRARKPTRRTLKR
jgi:hypothetical protein